MSADVEGRPSKVAGFEEHSVRKAVSMNSQAET